MTGLTPAEECRWIAGGLRDVAHLIQWTDPVEARQLNARARELDDLARRLPPPTKETM